MTLYMGVEATRVRVAVISGINTNADPNPDYNPSVTNPTNLADSRDKNY